MKLDDIVESDIYAVGDKLTFSAGERSIEVECTAEGLEYSGEVYPSLRALAVAHMESECCAVSRDGKIIALVSFRCGMPDPHPFGSSK